MPLVVDDHLLLDLVVDTHSAWLADELQRQSVYTTGSSYHRVALAMHRGIGSGAMSSRLADLAPNDQRRLL